LRSKYGVSSLPERRRGSLNLDPLPSITSLMGVGNGINDLLLLLTGVSLIIGCIECLKGVADSNADDALEIAKEVAGL
jgi:hypothetical protein